MKWLVIENCKHLNRSQFELVILASQRAYDLKSGVVPEIPFEDDDKSTVIALNELSQNKLDHEKLYKLAINRIVNFAGSGYSWVSSNKKQMDQKSFEIPEIIDEEEMDDQLDEMQKLPEDIEGISFKDDEEK
jgi:DNA-directed RNA polymerase subunit omega